MSPVLLAIVLSSLSPAQASADKAAEKGTGAAADVEVAAKDAPATADAPKGCTDVYDQTEGCKPPQKTLFIPKGEPLSTPTYNEFPIEVDQDALALQFVTAATMPAAFALSLHLLSGFYTIHTARLADAGTLRPNERDRIEQLQLFLLYGAIGSWFLTSLVAGTGVALWVFNPKSGEPRPLLETD